MNKDINDLVDHDSTEYQNGKSNIESLGHFSSTNLPPGLPGLNRDELNINSEDSGGGDPGGIDEIEINPNFKNTERAYPDALDGRPDSYVSKTLAEENQDAGIEFPIREKLKSTDDQKILNACEDAIKIIKQLELDRGEVNSNISAVREKLEAMGIPKASLAIAIKVSKMENDQMDGFFLALSYLLKSLDRLPTQEDWVLASVIKSPKRAD